MSAWMWLDRLVCRLRGHVWTAAPGVQYKGDDGVWRPYVSCLRCDMRQDSAGERG